MDSTQLARFIEETDSISKPWLLVLLRLQKLKERKTEISEADYLEQMQDIHQAMMNLGQWWVGIEDEVF